MCDALPHLQAHLENSQEEWLEKEIEYEKKITETEDRLSGVKVSGSKKKKKKNPHFVLPK